MVAFGRIVRRRLRSSDIRLAVVLAVVLVALLVPTSPFLDRSGATASPVPAAPASRSAPVASASHSSGAALPSVASVSDRYAALESEGGEHGLGAKLLHLPSTERAGVVNGRLVPGPEYQSLFDNVSPSYTGPPAPAGIGYYGESGSDVPGDEVATSVDTSSLAGTLNVTNLTTLYFDTDNPDQWGAQLNAVLVNVSLQGSPSDQGTPYSLWAQNTLSYQNLNDTLELDDNTWNLTSSGAGFPATGTATVVANDSTDFVYGTTLYEAAGPFLYAPPPFNLTLYLNTSLVNPFICTSESSVHLTSTCSDPATGTQDYIGDETLFFNYTFYDAKTAVRTHGTYDWLTFHTGSGSVFDPSNTHLAGFEADGYTPDAIGLSNDWELDVGIGAYDGADQVDLNGSGSASLAYVADCSMPTPSTPSQCSPSATPTFQSVPAAVDFGSETGETADGMSVTFGSAPATSQTALFSAGPMILHPLWGYSSQAGVAAGSTSVVNDVRVGSSGAPTSFDSGPAYVFIFLEDTSVTSPVDTFSWAPDVPTWHLMPGTYLWEAMLSDYQEETGSLTVGTSATTLSTDLVADSAAGVYTPLWAIGNAQLPGIAASVTTGSGAPTYYLINNSAPGGEINYLFSEFNDYAFPSFAGLLLWGTTDPTVVEGEVSFYVGTLAGIPGYLQEELYRTENVTILGASLIGGWPAMLSLAGSVGSQNPIPQANLMIWDSSHDLVARNQIVVSANVGGGYVSPVALMLYGGTDNVVWGNTFEDPSGSALQSPGSYGGVAEAEDGDLLYNNNFQVDNPVLYMPWDPYTEVPGPVWSDLWNVTESAASVAMVVNGFTLSGNVLGADEPFEGGNVWWDYGNSLNPATSVPFTNLVDYTDAAAVFPPGASSVEPGMTVGGDGVPLPGFDMIFQEQGLPAGTVWNVTVLGVTYSTSSDAIEFEGTPNGAYEYVAMSTGSWSSADSQGAADVDGAPVITLVSWVQAAYRVTFSESTLPADQVWTVTFNGTVQSVLTTGGSDSIVWPAVPNGTYAYLVGNTPGWHQSTIPYSGTITVSGGKQPIGGAGIGYSVTLSYAEATYNVTFSETGLPSGTGWNLAISSMAGVPSTGASISLDLTNGSYSFALTSSNPEYAAIPSTGIFSVSGSSVAESATFELVTFSISFMESGVSSGTPWWVNLSNGQSFVSRQSQLNFQEPNGSYTYTASAPGHSSATGNFTVRGNAVSLSAALPASASSSLGWVEWVALAAVIVVVVGLLVLLLRKRRGGASPSSSTPDTTAGAATAPGTK